MTELYFKGKEYVYNHHLAVPHRPLVQDTEKSIGKPELSGNLIVQGDNLHALKALLPYYADKIDCIFIDPPYNTGNEMWSYNDNVNAPMIKEWLASNPVAIDDNLRHDKWCAMMWPRLRLLHELLAYTGSLWMTLDNNEVHRCKLLLDEIFGEDNFIGEFIWRKKEGGGQTKAEFVIEHDYVIGYRKSENFSWVDNWQNVDEKNYNFKNSEGKKYRLVKLEKWGSEARAQDRPSMTFPIIDQQGNEYFPIAPDGQAGRWRVGKECMDRLIDEGLIEWKENNAGKQQPHEIILFDPDKRTLIKERSMLCNHGTTASASKCLTSIFGKKDMFETPKPVELISFILTHTSSENSLILDSFAGSGTTAHAVLDVNKNNGGNRKFILVEMDDKIANNVTSERMRRVINGYTVDGKAIEGLPGTFTYCTLGNPIDLDNILNGKNLPDYHAIAPVLFHMATNQTLDPATINVEKFYIGKTVNEHVWMIYRPDLNWLKSDEAALTLTQAIDIQKTDSDKRHLVFAPARFVSQKVLKEESLKICYVPFPDALYRIVRD